MTIPEYDDNRIAREARTRLDPWAKRGLTEAEYDEILAARLADERKEKESRLRKLIPQLVTAKQVKLAEFIAWQFKLDWNSYDTQNSMHAAELLLAGDMRMAYLILKGIIGFHPSDPPYQPGTVHPTPVSKGVEYRGNMDLNYVETHSKELLNLIGSKHNKRK